MEGLYKRMSAFSYHENQLLKSSLSYKKAQLEEKGYLFPTDMLNRRINELTNDPRKSAGF